MTRWRLLILVALATAVGALLRVSGLDAVPPGLHPDEAATAYEAYCLRTLGASSDGRSWPLTFCMHGRFWVEGTYVYLVSLSQRLPLSLTTQTRLPAALAGVALIPLTAHLARRLVSPRAAWVAAALLAVEPLAVHYSRVGLRATLAPPLVAGGLALLLARARGPRPDAARGLGAGALLALALWTYTPLRAWVPLLLAAFLLTCGRRASRWTVGVCVASAAAVWFAALPWTLSGAGRARLEEVSLLSGGASPLRVVGRFLRGYVLGFAPRTLLGGSSGRGFWAEGVGPLLWSAAPLVLLGAAQLARSARAAGPAAARARFLLLWLALYPVPAALTSDPPNLLRSVGVLPLFALLGAAGVRALGVRVRRRAGARAWRATAAALLLLLAAEAGWTAWSYRREFPRRERAAWFAAEGAALRELDRAAAAAGARVELRCHWVEAALAQAVARAQRPEVEFSEPARVRFGTGSRVWSARLSDGALVAREDAREVFRARVR